MGTKTISLADDASEQLKQHKREGESFSDVVRPLTRGVRLADYRGVLEEATADELLWIVEERREKRSETHRHRVAEVRDDLE
jgi:predicted CopG family antitoxin